ncbi:hypothetical protein OUZ56_029875 [Daphnia magna]|uniref:Uncharacterized protein n=1 Tax=Daphnia magna TaxID=35525 RepID=A0ABR0B852_9CRUS|nr:hypothetical protein OUZ56_029875 [Daphnia magna]
MASSVHHQPQQIDFESVSFQADAKHLVIAWSVLCDWDDCSVTAGMSNFSDFNSSIGQRRLSGLMSRLIRFSHPINRLLTAVEDELVTVECV